MTNLHFGYCLYRGNTVMAAMVQSHESPGNCSQCKEDLGLGWVMFVKSGGMYHRNKTCWPKDATKRNKPQPVPTSSPKPTRRKPSPVRTFF